MATAAIVGSGWFREDSDVAASTKEIQMTTKFAFLALSASALALTLSTGLRAYPREVPSAESSGRLPQELNLNLFRNPSIGLEYRLGNFALHAGMYPTIISKNAEGENQTSWFLRTGLSYFFLGHSFYGQRPSEFYASGSYTRGLNHGRTNGALADVGYRWMVWGGLNARLGVAVLLEPGHDVKVKPTPGIGWSHSGYPDILDRSAADVLPLLAAGGRQLRTGVAMMLGLLRWPTIEWTLARYWATASTEPRTTLAAVFDASNLFLGNVIGEFIGEMCTALWFVALGVAFLRAGRRTLGYLGAAAGVLVAVAGLRNITTAVALVADLNNITLPLWLLTLGVLFLRDRGGPEAPSIQTKSIGVW